MTATNGAAREYEWDTIVEPGEYIIGVKAKNKHNDTSSSRFVQIMVFILDGISCIGAHVRSKLCYLTCMRLLISSRADINRVILTEKTYFLPCVRNIQ